MFPLFECFIDTFHFNNCQIKHKNDIIIKVEIDQIFGPLLNRSGPFTRYS